MDQREGRDVLSDRASTGAKILIVSVLIALVVLACCGSYYAYSTAKPVRVELSESAVVGKYTTQEHSNSFIPLGAILMPIAGSATKYVVEVSNGESCYTTKEIYEHLELGGRVKVESGYNRTGVLVVRDVTGLIK